MPLLNSFAFLNFFPHSRPFGFLHNFKSSKQPHNNNSAMKFAVLAAMMAGVASACGPNDE
jgi:hypothetical protein